MLTLVLLAGAFVSFGAFVAVAYQRHWHWTGLPATPAAGARVDDRPAKTLWDWLQLLGIPIALAALAFLLNEAQSSRDQRREDQRAAQQRTVAADAERENTLRTYLAQMSDLILGQQLLRSKPGADVRTLAHTATLTAVRRLDGPRRGLIVQFLGEAQLLGRDRDESARSILHSADLRGARLRGAGLINANLGEVDLRGADLSQAYLFLTRFVQADLTGANLRDADLTAADFTAADLTGADFRGAVLHGTGLGDLNGTVVHLRGADFRGADLSGADLSGADLRGADLREANLRDADIRRADLSGAELRGAKLRGANLSRARGAVLTDSRGKPAHGP